MLMKKNSFVFFFNWNWYCIIFVVCLVDIYLLFVYRRWGSTVTGATATTRSTSGSSGAQQAFSRQMQRSAHVGRGRRSGVIVGTRPMVPASVVPEELISQVKIKCPSILVINLTFLDNGYYSSFMFTYSLQPRQILLFPSVRGGNGKEWTTLLKSPMCLSI